MIEERRDAAEMGIGTMIIFIAMVLVAAVAAGVLISTAYMVQQQAQETGVRAIKDVATGFKVLNVFGDRRRMADGTIMATIQNITVRITLEAGSPPINLTTTVIYISDGTISKDLKYKAATEADANNYTADAINDPAGVFTKSSPVVSSGTIVKLTINASAAGLNLVTQTSVELLMVPKHGTSTYESFTTPSTYLTRYVKLE
jgi:flagellin FlaB